MIEKKEREERKGREREKEEGERERGGKEKERDCCVEGYNYNNSSHIEKERNFFNKPDGKQVRFSS